MPTNKNCQFPIYQRFRELLNWPSEFRNNFYLPEICLSLALIWPGPWISKKIRLVESIVPVKNTIFDQKFLEVADIKIGTGHLHQNVSYHDKVPGLPGPGRSRDDTSYHVPWLDFWLKVHKKVILIFPGKNFLKNFPDEKP